MSETTTTIGHQSAASSQTKAGNTLFPVFLKLEQLRILVVGGGPVALEKLQALLGNAPTANVRLVAISILDEIRQLQHRYPNLQLEERAFAPTDLDATDIAIIAINNKSESQHIRTLARQRQVLVNVADTPDLCDFYLSSIVKKGQLKLAISTNGQSPTLAKRLKEVLSDALPDELDELAGNLYKLRQQLSGDFAAKVKALNQLTASLKDGEQSEKALRWRRIATWSLVVFASMLIGHFIFSYVPWREWANGTIDFYLQLDKNFGWILLAGFLAQLIDGSLGMGYGITSAAIMQSVGVNPAVMSGSIHTAEMFASGASGLSHYRFGNVNKKLFKALVIPGVVGAVAGALLLVRFGESHGQYVRPLIAAYTLLLGVRFIYNAFKDKLPRKKFKRYSLLAGMGGFLDSFGGGGWGPIVTSTLINRGRTPRFVIGTVSLTEFFVTLSSAFAFFIMIGVSHWQAIVALIIGSLIAAPIAARLAGKMPRKTAFVLLGSLIIIWSIRILVKIF